MEAKAAIAIAALVAAFGAGFWLSDMMAANRVLRAQNEAMAASIEASNTMRTRLEALDAKHTEELNHARAENDKLRTDLAAGAKRVRVAVTDCKPAEAARVDDAASTAELDPKVAADLAGIAADGDAAIRQLTALQEWIKTVSVSTSQEVIPSQAAPISGR